VRADKKKKEEIPWPPAKLGPPALGAEPSSEATLVFSETYFDPNSEMTITLEIWEEPSANLYYWNNPSLAFTGIWSNYVTNPSAYEAAYDYAVYVSWISQICRCKAQ
jgi:hypothetical protein